MGNNRGSKYGMGHTTLSRNDKNFWDYYQEEMGLIDTPMFIDFILGKTGLEQLSYIGHSEGTTQMFLAASLNPSYFKEKINLYIAMAPTPTTILMPTTPLTYHSNMLEFIMVDMFHYYNWFAPMPKVVAFVDVICDKWTFICNNIRDMLDIFWRDINNGERFDMFLSNEPSGQSYRTFIYHMQVKAANRTQLYDYGKIKNVQVYGST